MCSGCFVLFSATSIGTPTASAMATRTITSRDEATAATAPTVHVRRPLVGKVAAAGGNVVAVMAGSPDELDVGCRGRPHPARELIGATAFRRPPAWRVRSIASETRRGAPAHAVPDKPGRSPRSRAASSEQIRAAMCHHPAHAPRLRRRASSSAICEEAINVGSEPVVDRSWSARSKHDVASS